MAKDTDRTNDLDIAQAFLDSLLLVHNSFYRRQSTPIPVNQFGILVVLMVEHAASISDISHRLKISKQQMTTLIDRLLQAGYIEKNRSKTDRRQSVITMTEKGNELIEQQNDLVRQTFLKQLKKLSLEETRDMYRTIQKYNNYIQKMFQ